MSLNTREKLFFLLWLILNDVVFCVLLFSNPTKKQNTGKDKWSLGFLQYAYGLWTRVLVHPPVQMAVDGQQTL